MVLAMMAGAAALPVQAIGPADDKCDVNSGPLPLTNINLKAYSYHAGDLLKHIKDIPIAYSCTVYFDNNDQQATKYQPTLVTTTQFGDTVEALKNAGLKMTLTIHEDNGPGALTLGWDKVSQTGNGTIIRLPFGTKLPMKFQNEPVVTSRTGTLSADIYAGQDYQGAPVMINVPSMTAFEIIPVNTSGYPYKHGTGIQTIPFYIRIFPDNLGVVKITPSPVDFGRIYATSLDTLTKTSAPFTVTAEQKTGTTYPFDMPLNIEFDTGGQTLTADNQSIILDNGLKLSITDTESPDKKITFNKTYTMGTIHFLPSTGTGISKTYTAKVEPVSNKPDIKTGRFNAGVAVRVTYN
ncbi:TPA: fimbrial protein [Salmonella enterica]